MTMELKAINVKAQILPPGEIVAGRFKIGEMIGEGPFGQVFKAQDTLIEADVALKVFAADVLRNPLDQERFLNAARAARTLTQKNVVRLHDSGVHKDHPWVSMQHLEGLSLRKVLQMRESKNEHFRLEEIEPIISQITLALQHVSRENPHGDLKPENVIFLPDFIKVTDSFILSAIAPEVFAKRLGQSVYLAPELHTPDDHANGRCDVYSVGIIIGEMLYGRDYTPGSAPPGAHGAALDALCRRATAFDPAERYESVEALAEDLGTLVDTGRLLQARGARPPSPPPPPAPGRMPPVPPAANPLMAETSRTIGEPLQEDIATTEVKRTPPTEVKRPPVPVQLSDMLKTNEAGRNASARPRAGDVVTVIESIGVSREAKTSGPPVAIIVLMALVIIAVLIAVGLSSQESGSEVVSLGDGTAVAKDEPVAAVAEEPPKVEEPVEDAAQIARASLVFAQATQTREKASSSAATQAQSAADERAMAANAVASDASDSGQRAAVTPERVEQTGAPSRDRAPVEPTPLAANEGTECPQAMVLVRVKSGNFCVDAFEYPGQGATPKTHISWFEARKQCASQSKRLCELSEWRQACGPQYPYGAKFDADRCNTADEDGFERSLAKAGAHSKCRSRSGAFDMSGNVHEWVEEQRVAGGGFDSDEALASCRYSSPKAAGSSAANIGFRCCASAK
ncbi:MAG: protein kinase [Bradymonadaceae bacterium]|nr:protein kinase [Lujinxingiaceae bacterium]